MSSACRTFMRTSCVIPFDDSHATFQGTCVAFPTVVEGGGQASQGKKGGLSKKDEGCFAIVPWSRCTPLVGVVSDFCGLRNAQELQSRFAVCEMYKNYRATWFLAWPCRYDRSKIGKGFVSCPHNAQRGIFGVSRSCCWRREPSLCLTYFCSRSVVHTSSRLLRLWQ